MNEISILNFDVKFYTLYRKVKGNLSMITYSYWYNLYVHKYVCSTVWNINDAIFWCMMPHNFAITVQKLICQKYWDFTLQTEIEILMSVFKCAWWNLIRFLIFCRLAFNFILLLYLICESCFPLLIFKILKSKKGVAHDLFWHKQIPNFHH